MSPTTGRGRRAERRTRGRYGCRTVEETGRPTDRRGWRVADRHPASGHPFLILGRPLHGCCRASEGQGRQGKPQHAAEGCTLLAVAGSAGRLLCRLHDVGQFSLAAVVVHGRHPRVPHSAHDALFPAVDSAAHLRINDIRRPTLPRGWQPRSRATLMGPKAAQESVTQPRLIGCERPHPTACRPPLTIPAQRHNDPLDRVGSGRGRLLTRPAAAWSRPLPIDCVRLCSISR